MKTVHPGILHTPPCEGVAGRLPFTSEKCNNPHQINQQTKLARNQREKKHPQLTQIQLNYKSQTQIQKALI